MDSCPYCGDELTPGATTCGRCGMALDDAGDGDGADTPCPFCGADVPAGADSCPSCKTHLGEGEEEDPTTGPEGADPGAPGAASGTKTEVVDCPFCESPIPAKVHRCPECGRTIERLTDDAARAENTLIKLGLWGAFLGIPALVLLGLVANALLSADPGEKEFVDEDPAGLHGFLETASHDRARLRWQEVEGKYVVWEGEVQEVGWGALVLEAEGVRFSVDLAEDPSDGPAEGDRVEVEARLDARGGDHAFSLSDGRVRDG